MKSPAFLILYIIFYSALSQKDICTGEDGCVFAVKEYIFLPINDKTGNRNAFAENFDMKVMLAYSDRLVFFETSQNPIFEREQPPGKWLRTIFFSEITLDCGEDGNKICLAGELELQYPSFRISQAVINGAKDADKMCIAAPIIDSSQRPVDTSVLYICSSNQALLRDFYRMRDKISRWADTYQMRVVEEESSALNGVVRKQGNFKYFSEDGKELIVSLQLYFHKLRAYIDPSNFLTQVFEFSLKQVKENLGINIVSKALEDKSLSKASWEQFKIARSVTSEEKCCLYIPLKKGGVLKADKELYLCSVAKNDCDKDARIWASIVNIYLSRIKYIDEFDLLLNHGENLKCSDDFPELNPMKNRLKNIASFQDEMCRRLSITANTNQANACRKDKVDDVTEELRMLSKFNKGIQTALEECIKFRIVDIFSTTRFLEKRKKDKGMLVLI